MVIVPNIFILSGKIFLLYQKPIISVLSHDGARVSEIMKMIFTRLGDHRVFRHVFKSLVLLENLIKVGSAQVCFIVSSFSNTDLGKFKFDLQCMEEVKLFLVEVL